MTEVDPDKIVTCPRCKGKGTVVKNGPSEHEYDSAAPCPLCTIDRTALKGPGTVEVPW